MTKTLNFNKKSKTYIYICEMHNDGLTMTDISNHLQVDRRLVRLVIKEHFGSTVRDKKVSQKDVFTLPNVTNDIFLCQLALIANINQKTFYKLVETVRENYPEILVYFQANGNGDFYRTPNLDYEADLHIKSQE